MNSFPTSLAVSIVALLTTLNASLKLSRLDLNILVVNSIAFQSSLLP